MSRRDQISSASAHPMPSLPAAGEPEAAANAIGASPKRPNPMMVGDWAARQRLRAVDALRYSRFVSVMKGILPIAAVVLLASVVAYSVMPRQRDKYVGVKQSGNLARDLTMTKSSFTGTDEKGNPFKVTFAELTEDPTSKDHKRADLKMIDADMQFENQSWVSASAKHGWIDADAGILKLDGGISIFTDNGYTMQTERATALIHENVLQGDTAVSGHGPMGRFRADSFHVDRLKKQIKLSGHVHMTLFPQKASKR